MARGGTTVEPATTPAGPPAPPRPGLPNALIEPGGPLPMWPTEVEFLGSDAECEARDRNAPTSQYEFSPSAPAPGLPAPVALTLRAMWYLHVGVYPFVVFRLSDLEWEFNETPLLTVVAPLTVVFGLSVSPVTLCSFCLTLSTALLCRSYFLNACFRYQIAVSCTAVTLCFRFSVYHTNKIDRTNMYLVY